MPGQYQKLDVWQKSMDLAEQVYSLSQKLPNEERYSLGDQMRRAAVSIPSNIAEGKARGDKEFVHFLKIANGSRMELETQLLLCKRLKYLPSSGVEPALNALEEIGKMLISLIKYLAKSSRQSTQRGDAL